MILDIDCSSIWRIALLAPKVPNRDARCGPASLRVFVFTLASRMPNAQHDDLSLGFFNNVVHEIGVFSCDRLPYAFDALPSSQSWIDGPPLKGV